MASDKGAPKDVLDERLAGARDAALAEGEEIFAQEMGDQGQAIVVTKSRVLILKAGLTATGTLNGLKTTDFPVEKITAVHVRKGPMGAVIHVCTDDAPEPTAQPGPKGNIIVFTTPERIQRCNAIAAKIESVIGKPVNWFEPQPDAIIPETVEAVTEEPKAEPPKMRGGRIAKTLTEEMYGEPDLPEPPAVEPKPAEVETTVEPEPVAVGALAAQIHEPALIDPLETVEEEVIDNEAPAGFRPNPNLPKPARKKQAGPNRVLVLLGALGALVLVGMAVTAPLRQPVATPTVEINVSQLTKNAKLVRRQWTAVSKYREQVMGLLKKSDKTAAAVASAVRSGNRQVIAAALSSDESDVAWRKLSELNVPSGLAGARESLVSGLFIRKSAVESASALGALNPSETIRRLTDADTLIKRGTGAVDKMLSDLQAKLPTRSPRDKK